MLRPSNTKLRAFLNPFHRFTLHALSVSEPCINQDPHHIYSSTVLYCTVLHRVSFVIQPEISHPPTSSIFNQSMRLSGTRVRDLPLSTCDREKDLLIRPTIASSGRDYRRPILMRRKFLCRNDMKRTEQHKFQISSPFATGDIFLVVDL